MQVTQNADRLRTAHRQHDKPLPHGRGYFYASLVLTRPSLAKIGKL